MAKAIHSMIRVLDEARSVDFYQRAFGLRVADRLDFEAFTLVYLSNDESPFEVELTVNKGRTEPYDLGDGYGHLAVLVADLEAEHARFAAEGSPPARSSSLPPTAGSSAGSSSWPTPTATRSRCSSAAGGSDSARPGAEIFRGRAISPLQPQANITIHIAPNDAGVAQG